MTGVRYCAMCGRELSRDRPVSTTCSRKCWLASLRPKDDPTEEEIRQRCQQIQAGWDEATELLRRIEQHCGVTMPELPAPVFLKEPPV